MAHISTQPQTTQRQEKSSKLLCAGTKATDFTLHATPDQVLTLSDLKGQPVILAFYPADWSPVCGDQISLYNEALPEFALSDHREKSAPTMRGRWQRARRRRTPPPPPRDCRDCFRSTPFEPLAPNPLAGFGSGVGIQL